MVNASSSSRFTCPTLWIGLSRSEALAECPHQCLTLHSSPSNDLNACDIALLVPDTDCPVSEENESPNKKRQKLPAFGDLSQLPPLPSFKGMKKSEIKRIKKERERLEKKAMKLQAKNEAQERKRMRGESGLDNRRVSTDRQRASPWILIANAASSTIKVSRAPDLSHARPTLSAPSEPLKVAHDYTIPYISNGSEPTTQTSRNRKRQGARRSPKPRKRRRNREGKSGSSA